MFTMGILGEVEKNMQVISSLFLLVVVARDESRSDLSVQNSPKKVAKRTLTDPDESGHVYCWCESRWYHYPAQSRRGRADYGWHGSTGYNQSLPKPLTEPPIVKNTGQVSRHTNLSAQHRQAAWCFLLPLEQVSVFGYFIVTLLRTFSIHCIYEYY